MVEIDLRVIDGESRLAFRDMAPGPGEWTPHWRPIEELLERMSEDWAAVQGYLARLARELGPPPAVVTLELDDVLNPTQADGPPRATRKHAP